MDDSGAWVSETGSFSNLFRTRQSVRAFLPDPVPRDILSSVLQDAQFAPSNCNTQPWLVHIVSKGSRDAVSGAMLAADARGELTPDFSFRKEDVHGVYGERLRAQGAAYYHALGVPREALRERKAASLRNLCFFDAPHAAFLFMPEFGDNVRVAADIGMYGQTLLLSLAAHGLGGVPQTLLGMYAGTIRDVLGIDPAFKLLFGISFGYPDWSAAANKYRIDRVAIEESVVFHD
ncbi:nitroreductase [Sphingobium sp.]|uniref:nitroreductase n=1 Tax=Sphingobium sp. TaxID=1912891 RepID=UPI002B9695EC|nr:nitroreductase [Sphingobium sp.]HUD90696.1 nitroreductase [Sphingobium sp.]